MITVNLKKSDYKKLTDLMYQICDNGTQCNCYGYAGDVPPCDICPVYVERLQHMIHDGSLIITGDE